MAHKAAGSSTALGRESRSQRLGVKIFGGQKVDKGQIIVRQRGTKYHPGKNTALGKDDTIYSLINGIVAFHSKKAYSFTKVLKKRTFVNVLPSAS